MHGWRDEDGEELGHRRQSGWRLRAILGQLLVVLLLVGAVWIKLSEPSPVAVTGGPSPEPTQVQPLAVNVRGDSVPPTDVSLISQRFLTALSEGNVADAVQDLAPGSLSSLNNPSRLNNAAKSLQAARARSFRPIFWQTSPSQPDQARLTVIFDYDRPDSSNARSRVGISVLMNAGRWYVAEVDFAPWMSDLGLNVR